MGKSTRIIRKWHNYVRHEGSVARIVKAIRYCPICMEPTISITKKGNVYRVSCTNCGVLGEVELRPPLGAVDAYHHVLDAVT